MYLWALDSVNVARNEDGSAVEQLLTLARRAMKLSLLLGEPIELGEPHLIDNTFVLAELDRDENFARILRDCPSIKFFLAQRGGGSTQTVATPKQLLLNKMTVERWWSSAWRVPEHQDSATEFQRWLAGEKGSVRDPHILDKDAVKESHDLSASVQRGLDVLNGIIEHKLDNRRRLSAPDFNTGGGDLCFHIRRGAKLLQGRIDADTAWVSSRERDYCESAIRRIDRVMGELPKTDRNFRSAWLNVLIRLAREEEDLFTWPDAIARCIVNTAYNRVVARSFGSSRLFTSESPLFIQGSDAAGDGIISEPTITALLASEPAAGSASAGGAVQPFVLVEDLDALDNVSWDNLANALGSGAYHEGLKQIRTAKPEERACRRLEFAIAMAGRVALNWRTEQRTLPGSEMLNGRYVSNAEFVVIATMPIVEAAAEVVNVTGGILSAGAQFAEATVKYVFPYVYNFWAQEAARRKSLGLRGQLQDLLRQGQAEDLTP